MNNYIPNFTNRNKYVTNPFVSNKRTGIRAKIIRITICIIFILFLVYTFYK